ncbi:MAG TPA: response regulator transcription factor [Candidatus Dormibacteraeota bacterium]|nr:response regulator transcription factor [Candidatus Dormibacteraeota bacterium]
MVRNHRDGEVVKVTESGRHILVLEAAGDIRQRMGAVCEQRGYQLTSAATMDEAFAVLRQNASAILLVDLGPGSLDGLAACRDIRGAGCSLPIVVISSLVDPIDAVLAFELGADDFVRRPYQPREVLARIDAHVRRLQRVDRDIVVGPLRISQGRRTVWRDGVEVQLTRTEFDLLLTLARRPERPATREELIRETGMHADVDARTVDAHIHRLRRKLEPCLEHPTFIQSVTGQGYRLVVPRARLAGAA